MNPAHLHLMITHLPIFGSILGAMVLVYGIWCRNKQTKIAAYYLFIVSAVGAVIAYTTGEGAEEAVEKIQGISKNLIDEHEDAGLFALISLIVLGIASLISLIITYKDNKYSGKSSIVMLVLSLISFSIVARTGYLGGQIRHTEINKASVQNNNPPEARGKDDD
jgi:uncharacterized membrane protein